MHLGDISRRYISDAYLGDLSRQLLPRLAPREGAGEVQVRQRVVALESLGHRDRRLAVVYLGNSPRYIAEMYRRDVSIAIVA